ncbi:MAG: hypothetical protein A2104_07720 [Candidatus Melainabacteria bacterium GWF2_32_7]|nr:MAG: hypothetical protein A2104_07720 [Candidatus Melainabacteria bacterium GWF2_32_7]
MTNSISRLILLKNNIPFQGYRSPDPRTIMMSDKNTINNYIKAGKDVIGPDFVLGEKTLAELLTDKLQSTLHSLLDPEVQEEAKKIRKGLDLIA